MAANGFRFRVPYGTLLCVSDKPIHGELKLQVGGCGFICGGGRLHGCPQACGEILGMHTAP